MEKLKVIIDFDNTIVDFMPKWLDDMGKIANNTMSVSDLTYYDVGDIMSSVYKLSNEVIHNCFTETFNDDMFYDNVNILPIGHIILNNICSDDSVVSTIHTKSPTTASLKSKEEFISNNVVFNNVDNVIIDIVEGDAIRFKPKNDIGDLIIDDHMHYINTFLDVNKGAIGFLVDQPWNRHIKLPKNVIRVTHKNILDEFKKVKKRFFIK
jgi:5'(3')-deoxyribonucleotidase